MVNTEDTIRRVYYAPIYFRERDPNDTTCTLLVRIFKHYKTPSGKTVTTINIDSYSYSSEDIMVMDIKDQDMLELPKEAETKPYWCPDDLKADSVRRVWR